MKAAPLVRGGSKRPEELRCRPGFVLPRISVRLGLSPVAYFKLPGSSTGLRLATRDSSTLAPAGNDVNRFSAIFSLMFAHNDFVRYRRLTVTTLMIETHIRRRVGRRRSPRVDVRLPA